QHRPERGKPLAMPAVIDLKTPQINVRAASGDRHLDMIFGRSAIREPVAFTIVMDRPGPRLDPTARIAARFGAGEGDKDITWHSGLRGSSSRGGKTQFFIPGKDL